MIPMTVINCDFTKVAAILHCFVLSVGLFPIVGIGLTAFDEGSVLYSDFVCFDFTL